MNRTILHRMLSIALCCVLLLSMIPRASADEGAAVQPRSVSYYGREQLAAMANATALLYAYDQLVAGVEATLDTIEIHNGTDPISSEEVEIVMDAYIRDYTHHFWLGNSYSIMATAETCVSVKPSYLYTGAQLKTARDAFEKGVAKILGGLKSGMSEFEKELYLHDKLAAMVTYQSSDNAHNAYGAIVEGIAVCEGYAEALQYLLQRAGIQSFIALGQSINPVTHEMENHAWNYVRIDGKYYHVDLTWNDQGENLFHAYFNQTDKTIKEDHLISPASYDLPSCTATKAMFFTGKDTYLESYDAAKVGKLLKDNDYTVHLYIPGSMNDFAEWVDEKIIDIATAAKVSGSFTYGYMALGRELILFLNVEETTEPEDTEPEATEAKPTEPKPTETKPAETKPTEPKPTEPKPTEPKPTEPKPTEPKPTEPKPTEPKPTEPKPTEPKPTEPKPTEPKPTEPEVTEPKPTEPMATTPGITEPKPTEPQATAPETTTPEATNPDEPNPTEGSTLAPTAPTEESTPAPTDPADHEDESGQDLILWIALPAVAVVGGVIALVVIKKKQN